MKRPSKSLLALAVCLACVATPSAAFALLSAGWKTKTRLVSNKILASQSALGLSAEPIDELSEERQANLFQFLLRDLQVEGVPLLEVDAHQVHTLQAALWTTMAELSEQTAEQKACLIFESIPVGALRSFVDDFMILKTQDRLMQSLPELERFSLSLVGKGVGPAIVVETAEKKEEDSDATTVASIDEAKLQFALHQFADRMIAGRQVPGYPASSDTSTPPPKTTYKTCASAEVCHILSAFWTSICEQMTTSSAEQQPVTMLSLPALTTSARFGAVAELLSRSLCLYRGDDVLELLHLFPAYDRSQIHPVDKPAHGHLPPLGWLRAMLQYNGNTEQAERLTDEELALLNYQRRAPVTAVCIVPVDLLEATNVVDLDLGDGRVVMASGIGSYSESVIDLSERGKEELQSSLDAEIRSIQ